MEIQKYLNHLPTCNKMQDWTEAQQAMADVPNKFRDEGYAMGVAEMYKKQNTCTCGLNEIISKLSQNNNGWVAYDFKKPETRPKKYDRYFVHRKDGKVHWEIWNGSAWAYNENSITHWKEIDLPTEKQNKEE
jgi:hypothetical protein